MIKKTRNTKSEGRREALDEVRAICLKSKYYIPELWDYLNEQDNGIITLTKKDSIIYNHKWYFLFLGTTVLLIAGCGYQIDYLNITNGEPVDKPFNTSNLTVYKNNSKVNYSQLFFNPDILNNSKYDIHINCKWVKNHTREYPIMNKLCKSVFPELYR